MEGETTTKPGLLERGILKSRVKSSNVKIPEIVFGYLIGPFGAMLAGGVFSSFLNKYWTETLFAGQITAGVNTFLTLLPALSAILIVIGNLLAGQIIERTRSRAGKARPWILLSAVTVTITCILMFVWPYSMNVTAKCVLTGISYNLYYAIASPLYNTANSTMIPVSTRNGKQRSLLASASNIAGLGVMGAGSMVFPILLGLLVTESTLPEQAQTYWLILIIIVGALALIGSLLQYYFSRERVTEENMVVSTGAASAKNTAEKIPVKKQVRAVVTDRFWWLIIIAYLLFQVTGAIKNTSMTYFTANMDNSFWGASLDANTAAGMSQTLLAVLGAVPMAVAVLFVWPLSNVIGKQKLTIIGMVVGVIGGIIAGIFSTSVVGVAIGVAIKCLGSAPMGYLILAMISDSLDHIEAKHGFRCDGFTMSIYSSIMVASTPIAQAIFNGISNSGQNAMGVTIGYIWIDTAAYALVAIILIFFFVEKYLNSDQKLIRDRQKAKAEANGEVWIEPEERMRLEEEEAERKSEESRVQELKDLCAKKGLDFDAEEAKYQAAKAEKDKAAAEKKAASDAAKAAKAEEKRKAKEAKEAEKLAKFKADCEAKGLNYEEELAKQEQARAEKIRIREEKEQADLAKEQAEMERIQKEDAEYDAKSAEKARLKAEAKAAKKAAKDGKDSSDNN